MYTESNHRVGIIQQVSGLDLGCKAHYHPKELRGVNWIRRGELKLYKRIRTQNINANDDVYFEEFALAA